MINKLKEDIKRKFDFFKSMFKDIFKSFRMIDRIVSVLSFFTRLIRSPVLWVLAAMYSMYEFEQWVRDKVLKGMTDAERQAIESGDVKGMRQHLENRRQYEIDKSNQTGDALDAGAYTDPMVIGNITINPAEIKKELKRRFEESRDTAKDAKIRQNAINALAQIEAEDDSKKLKYFRENNINPKTATEQQLKAAQDYADEKINIKGQPTWIKPSIATLPTTPQTKEEKETATVIEKLPQNFLKWLEKPTEDTADDKMYMQMWNVIKENPVGPWEFDKKIPGYNEWNRTAPNIPKKPVSVGELTPETKSLNIGQLMDENMDLANQVVINRRKSTTGPQTTVASAGTPTKKPNSGHYQMPLGRNLQESFREATLTSFVG